MLIKKGTARNQFIKSYEKWAKGRTGNGVCELDLREDMEADAFFYLSTLSSEDKQGLKYISDLYQFAINTKAQEKKAREVRNDKR